MLTDFNMADYHNQNNRVWVLLLQNRVINEVKDVNSFLNDWLWLSCNLFLYSFHFIAPPSGGHACSYKI